MQAMGARDRFFTICVKSTRSHRRVEGGALRANRDDERDRFRLSGGMMMKGSIFLATVFFQKQTHRRSNRPRLLSSISPDFVRCASCRFPSNSVGKRKKGRVTPLSKHTVSVNTA